MPVEASSTGSATQSKGKIEKAHTWLATISTAIGVLGGLGTLGVWLVANFYTGQVEIRPDKVVREIQIKAYDRKGQQATFYGPRFELMPGDYHLEIVAAGQKPQLAEVNVKFRETVVVPISVVDDAALGPADRSGKKAGRPWWRFWR